MYEIKVIWSDEPEDFNTYVFENQKEAAAFQYGITETEARLPNCPKVAQILISKWGPKRVEEPSTNGLHIVLHAVFLGLWTVLWWHLYAKSLIWVEYLLVGMLSTLIYLIGFIFYALFKKYIKRKADKQDS